MDDARLVIVESWQDVPLKGGCSACPSVIFDAGVLIGSKNEQESMLRTMFDVHWDRVHQSTDEPLIFPLTKPRSQLAR